MKYYLFFLSLAGFISSSENFDHALEIYTLGEQSSSFIERQEHFNQALSLFLDLKTEQSSALDLALGNTYLQLGEHAYALLHYHRALTEFPRESIVKENLQIARQEAGLDTQFMDGRFELSFVSLTEWQAAFLIFLSITFILWSLYIWKQNALLKFWAVFTSFSVFLLLCILLIQVYARPSAILLKGSHLHRGPGLYYEKVSTNLLLPGMLLKVIRADEGMSWVFVQGEDEREGFLPSTSLLFLHF